LQQNDTEYRIKKRNRLTYGIGTIGRDMVYSLVSMYLIFYLTDIIRLPTATMWWVAGIIFAGRIFDAINDPIMGFIVDNTHTRMGKFKPWIAIGAVLSALFTVLLFTDFGLTGSAFAVTFAIIYLMWGIGYTVNDIPYWSMLPTLSIEQKEREKIGAIARICANIGTFSVVAAIVPLTGFLGERFGSPQKGYFILALFVSIALVAGQCVTLFGVKEIRLTANNRKSTPLRELLQIIYRNDQLFFIAIALSFFMIGIITTYTFGLYYFKYAYGNENMYPVFALIAGTSQIAALAIFPLLSRHFRRETLYNAATLLIVTGFVIFFFAPVTTIIYIAAAGVLLFTGQSFMQLLMLMFLADSVDYGHWKLGKRNDSISFSLQPFISKTGGAISSGVVSAVVIVSGIKDADVASDVTAQGLLLLKIAMLIFPLVCVVVSFIICRKKYRIDSRFHGQIISDLRKRGEIIDDVYL